MLCIPHVTVLSIIQTLQEFQIEGTFKWVNDTLVSGRRISGILADSTGRQVEHDGEMFKVCLIGIGINVNLKQDPLLHIAQPDTSMLVAAGKEFEVEVVLSSLAIHLRNNIGKLFTDGFGGFLEDLDLSLERFHGEPIVLLKDIDRALITGMILKGEELRKALLNTEVVSGLIKYQYFEVIPSTQTYARECLALVEDGFWRAFRVGHQTAAGFGTKGKAWHDKAGSSLLVTYMLPYHGGLSAEQISQISGLSVKSVLDGFGCDSHVRWLNRVFSGGGKVSGNLVEILEYGETVFA